MTDEVCTAERTQHDWRLLSAVFVLTTTVGYIAMIQILPVVYGAFAVIGLSITLSTYEAAFAVIVVVTAPGQRDRAILTVTMIAGLSTYLVYPLLGWMNTELGWRATVAVLGAVYALTCVP